jgi:hypothetical protein
MRPGEKSHTIKKQKLKIYCSTTKEFVKKVFRLAYLFLKNAYYLKIGRTVSTVCTGIPLSHTKSEVKLKSLQPQQPASVP